MNVFIYLTELTNMQAAVAGVMGRVKERHKIQLALKYLKSKLTEFRSEER